MTVVILTDVSSGLESASAAVLTVGKADFTVTQKGVLDILYSNLGNDQVVQIKSTKGYRFYANGTGNTVVGIYSAGISYSDLGACSRSLRFGPTTGCPDR